MAHLVGTVGGDTLVGTPDDDLIEGLAGNDRIVIGDAPGNDTILGGDGGDTLDASGQTAGTTVSYSGAGEGTLVRGRTASALRGSSGSISGGATMPSRRPAPRPGST